MKHKDPLLERWILETQSLQRIKCCLCKVHLSLRTGGHSRQRPGLPSEHLSGTRFSHSGSHLVLPRTSFWSSVPLWGDKYQHPRDSTSQSREPENVWHESTLALKWRMGPEKPREGFSPSPEGRCSPGHSWTSAQDYYRCGGSRTVR